METVEGRPKASSNALNLMGLEGEQMRTCLDTGASLRLPISAL
jgi:hypothetical protein